MYVFFFKQKTAYEMRISDWSSDVCSSDLTSHFQLALDGDHAGAVIALLDGADCLFQRSEEHTSELQSLMRISYAVFCLKKKKLPFMNRMPDMKNRSIINQRTNTSYVTHEPTQRQNNKNPDTQPTIH